MRKSVGYDFSCSGVNTFVNKLDPLNGDMFQTGRIWNAVKVVEGYNVAYVRLKMKGGQGKFRCLYKRTPSSAGRKIPFQMFGPRRTPDLLNDFDSNGEFKLMGNAIAIPVINFGTEGRSIGFKSSSTQIRIINNPHGIHAEDSHIGPSQTSDLPLRLQLSRPINRRECPITFSIIGYDIKDENLRTEPISISLRCRMKNESFLFSYEDHDGSISIAAAVPPMRSRNVSSSKECAHGNSYSRLCPVVLSLHGTGVDVQMQADSYKFKGKGAKDSQPYIFGVQNAWLIAATRGGAHNWEYTGHLAALKALESLPSIVTKNVPSVPGLDVERVLFAGHSMGGHGSWVQFIHNPDRAIGAVSIAGWIRKEAYGDSNRFLLHDIGHSYIDPAMKSIIETTFSEFSVDLHSSSLVGLPVLIRVGENDFSVPPWYSRKMSRLLIEHGSNSVTYDEVPGKSHWWWDTIYPNDGGVMNDKKMRLFYQSIIKDGLQPPPQFPQKIVYVVLNPANSQGRGGFRVIQQMISYRKSQVSIEKVVNASTTTSQSDAILKVKTLNVKVLRVIKMQLGDILIRPRSKKVMIVLKASQQFVVDLEQRLQMLTSA